MRKILQGLAGREEIRYLFFGGCTTALNLGVFLVLRHGFKVEVTWANLASIIAAILFAFFVNKRWVFQSKKNSVPEVLLEFVNFTGMRLSTMLVEFFGVNLLIYHIGTPEIFGKLLIQAVVIILNYVISRWLVFRPERLQEV